jgi:hypothetical protein
VLCGLHIPPDLVACGFYLWGSLKIKVVKQIPCNVEEIRTNTCCEIPEISAESELIPCSAGTLTRGPGRL